MYPKNLFSVCRKTEYDSKINAKDYTKAYIFVGSNVFDDYAYDFSVD